MKLMKSKQTSKSKGAAKERAKARSQRRQGYAAAVENLRDMHRQAMKDSMGFASRGMFQSAEAMWQKSDTLRLAAYELQKRHNS